MLTNSKTETTVLVAVTLEWFSSSNWSIDRFAEELLAPRLIEAGLLPPFPAATGDEYMRARRTFGKRVGRIFNGDQPFPLEWKWPWLCSLPESHYQLARAELLAMAGVFDIRLPMPSLSRPHAMTANLADCLREFGEFVAASSPAADGSYHGKDDPAAVDAMMREGLEAMERIANELVAVQLGTGRALPRQPIQAAFDLLKKADEANRSGGFGHA
ncbi:MAG: hypothetical protein VX796_09265 [Pseudomonadota bacterium]|nr:hypothetical protein [Pseudomonadota bacterium]